MTMWIDYIVLVSLSFCARCILRFFWLVPIKRNRIVFQSFEEGASCNDNPAYICRYLREHYEGKYELIWALKDIEKQQSGICAVKYRSLKWFYYMATAKIIIINVRPTPFLIKRKGQVVINTWHGGGAYKRTGVKYDSIKKRQLWEEKQVLRYMSIFLSSSIVFTEKNINEAFNYGFKGKILNTGMPRTDILFNRKKIDECSKKVRDKYGFGDDYIVLFAPTFRGRKVKEAISEIPDFGMITNRLKSRFSKDVHIMVRSHPKDKNHYCNDNYLVDVKDYPDMQELLCAADMLITDYSSSIWDFAILGRPCLLFVSDLKEYLNNDRGFFTPIEKWPGIICTNNDELLTVLDSFTIEECKKKAEDHLTDMGSYERGNACKKIASLIEKLCSK